MTARQFADYRKAARQLVPGITAIEVRYCWFADISLAWIAMKVAQLRLEESPTKKPRTRHVPKWLQDRKPRQPRLESSDDMHGRARALLRKIIP